MAESLGKICGSKQPRTKDFACVLPKDHIKSKDEKTKRHDYGYNGKGHPAPKEQPIKIPNPEDQPIPQITKENDILLGLANQIKVISVRESEQKSEVKDLLEQSVKLDTDKRQAESKVHELTQNLVLANEKIAESEEIHNQEIDSMKADKAKESKLSMEVMTKLLLEIKELKKKLG